MKRLEWYPSKDLVVDSSLSRSITCEFISSKESRVVPKYIPHHLITEILLRTCAKSLVRFKSVCKEWYSLIDDPDFIHQYFNRTTKFCVLSVTPYMERDEFYLTSVENDCDREWKSNCQDLSMSSCNSLICFFGNSYIYICNPTTQEFINPSIIRYGNSCCGFGFDERTNCYKVVQLKNFRFENVGFRIDNVFTLGKSRTGTPIRTEDVPMFVGFKDMSSTFINGSICWVVMDLERSNSILCFDVGDEKFRLIQVPESCRRWEDDDHDIVHNSLVELEGKICFAEQNRVKEMLDIWMLKDSVEEETTTSTSMWIKKYSIATNDVTNLRSLRITPLCIQNAKILLQLSSRELVSYDIESKKCGQVFKLQDGWHTIVYKESLICLRDMMQADDYDPFHYRSSTYRSVVAMASLPAF